MNVEKGSGAIFEGAEQKKKGDFSETEEKFFKPDLTGEEAMTPEQALRDPETTDEQAEAIAADESGDAMDVIEAHSRAEAAAEQSVKDFEETQGGDQAAA